jgi:ABC-2 type transport system ATP-binding protein
MRHLDKFMKIGVNMDFQNEVVFKSYNLTKTYQTIRAVDSVNMTVYKGDIYGLIGPNGAGKTTILRMLVGLAFPTSGKVELLGVSDSNQLIKTRKRIGMIVETPNLIQEYNAYDALLWHSKIIGASPEVIPDLLKLVGLENTNKLIVKNFSLGMKQRLAIAQAFLNDPDLLVLDEPTNGMDPEGIIEIRELLLKLNKEHGTTIIISSHILSELSQLVNRVGIIRDGKLVDEKYMKDIKTKQSGYYELHVSDIEATISYLNATNIQYINRGNHFKIPLDNKLSKIVEGLEALEIVIYDYAKKTQDLEEYYIDKLGGNE